MALAGLGQGCSHVCEPRAVGETSWPWPGQLGLLSSDPRSLILLQTMPGVGSWQKKGSLPSE